MSLTLTTSGRQTVVVEDNPFASGGEGAVHRIVSPPAYSGRCAKLYFQQYRTKARERKIEFMVGNPLPNLDGMRRGGCTICWPTELLYQRNKFVGFVMPRAFDNSALLYELCTPVIKRLPAVWKAKYDRTKGKGVESRMKLCVNIAAAINFVHSQGKYVFVDFKPQNILVTDDGRVSLIDLDSIQIANNGKVVFPAQAATPEYVPLEGNHINPSRDIIPETWDRFSLAVVFYELLFGLHPYAASYQGQYKDSSTVADSIRNGLFVFGSKKNYVYRRPPLHDNFARIPPALQGMFIRAFDKGHTNPVLRPKAAEWGSTIFGEVVKFKDQPKGFQPPPMPTVTRPKPPAPTQKPKPPAAPATRTAQTPAPTSGSSNVTGAVMAVVFFLLLLIACAVLASR
jgi:DNA-binding helix-hairpin-helix protein with protein kinase domain